MAGNVIRGSEGKKRVISVKAGGGVSLGGMKPDLDPSSLPAQDFVSLENVRRIGGLVVSRGGQAEFAELEGEATGMVDFQMGGGSKRLFLLINNDVYEYNPAMNPVAQLVSEDLWDGSRGSAFLFEKADIEASGDLPGFSGYVIIDRNVVPAKLWKMQVAQPSSGLARSTVVEGAALVPILDVPLVGGVQYGGTGNGGFVVQSGSNLFIPTKDATDNAAIFRFDGLSLVREFTIADPPNGPTIIGGVRFRDTVVYFRAESTPQLTAFIRTEAGTWTTVGPTASVATTVQYMGMASYMDKLYAAILDKNIYLFDGTTLTVIPPATSGVDNSADTKIYGVVVMGRYLYFIWSLGPAPYTKVRVGRFDGTTWLPNHKDLLAQFPDIPDGTPQYSLAAWQGSLYTGAFDGSLDFYPALFKSPGDDVDGAWEQINLGLTVSSDVYYILPK